jgi:hypothetical protein
MTKLIEDLTGWIPWLWLRNLTLILLYLGVLSAFAVGPLVAWLAWAGSSAGRRRDA